MGSMSARQRYAGDADMPSMLPPRGRTPTDDDDLMSAVCVCACLSLRVGKRAKTAKIPEKTLKTRNTL